MLVDKSKLSEYQLEYLKSIGKEDAVLELEVDYSDHGCKGCIFYDINNSNSVAVCSGACEQMLFENNLCIIVEAPEVIKGNFIEIDPKTLTHFEAPVHTSEQITMSKETLKGILDDVIQLGWDAKDDDINCCCPKPSSEMLKEYLIEKGIEV